MKILLTGACGHLGRALRRVGAQEHTFVLLDLAAEVEAFGGIRASITDREAVRRAAKGCDAIIHTAAMHGECRQTASNADFITTNLLAAEHLFQAAIEHGIRRLVMSSTAEVVIGRLWDAAGMAVVDEQTPPQPDWIYPVTKLQVEQLGRFYAHHHGLEVVSLRYMAFCDQLPAWFGLRLLARYLTAEDCAVANLRAASVPGLRDQVIHIGPETPLTQTDITEAQSDPWAVLERYWPGCRYVLEEHDHEPLFKWFWPVTRIDLAKLILGWQPTTRLETFLNTLGWQRPQ